MPAQMPARVPQVSRRTDWVGSDRRNRPAAGAAWPVASGAMLKELPSWENTVRQASTTAHCGDNRGMAQRLADEGV